MLLALSPNVLTDLPQASEVGFALDLVPTQAPTHTGRISAHRAAGHNG